MFNELLGAAKSMLGGAGGDEQQQQQLAGAVSDHVGTMEPNDLVGHLLGMIPNLPPSARTELASTVMGALGNAGTSQASVEQAGVPVGDAMNGDHAALGALLTHATQNPAGLKDAALRFIASNPQLVQQYAPELLRGVLGRFGV